LLALRELLPGLQLSISLFYVLAEYFFILEPVLSVMS